MRIRNQNFIPDWSRPGLPTTTTGGEGEEEDVYRDSRERRSGGQWRFRRPSGKGVRAGTLEVFEMFYQGVDGKRNGVGGILKEEYSKSVVEVKRVSDRLINVKLEVEGVISVYAPQVGCEMEEKEKFWSKLDEVVEGEPRNERLVIGADFNEHVGEGNRGDEEVMVGVALRRGLWKGRWWWILLKGWKWQW
ncbi:hypothetical protein C0J45_5299 [Silurus meridionalis]|nr:hypothetical protein C0J45_5299 [Silurus meridionalis]